MPAERPTLADNVRRLTTPELKEKLRGTTGVLRAVDLKATDVVVLVAGNTIEAVVVYHALLAIGTTTVLLDRRCGSVEVDHALVAAGDVALLLVPESERRLIREHHPRSMSLEEVWARASSPVAGSAERTEPNPEATVVLFTSGTTSRPKGVVHSLATLRAGAANMAVITGADERTVVFLVSPMASITGVMQMHLVADHGGALVLEDRFDPSASLDRINEVGATLLGGAPVIAERLLRVAMDEGRPITIATLALGGAMLPRPLLDLATHRFGITIARVYGSSEAPNFSGSLPTDSLERRLSDDGALMDGSDMRVGSTAHPQEGLVRGPGVFLGYLDPEDNAAAFEDGWFRTGDLVEVEDGRVTVVGRLKEVVNRNGLKISLSEIDAALADLPGLIEYSTFCVPDSTTGERLAVAARPESATPVTLADVVAHLTARGISRRKLPEQLTIWDEPLPRTTSGKVVRSRLVMDAPSKCSELADRVGEVRSARSPGRVRRTEAGGEA